MSSKKESVPFEGSRALWKRLLVTAETAHKKNVYAASFSLGGTSLLSINSSKP